MHTNMLQGWFFFNDKILDIKQKLDNYHIDENISISDQ